LLVYFYNNKADTKEKVEIEKNLEIYWKRDFTSPYFSTKCVINCQHKFCMQV